MRIFTRSLALAGGLLVVTAPLASAHVTVSADSTASGGYTVLKFSVPHGCDGSGTTKVSVQMPESIPTVSAMIGYNWTINKVMTPLSAPLDIGHGKTINERVSEVVYTANAPLPDGYRDTFELSVKLPAGKAGDKLVFPVIQTCQVGETGWIETPAPGQDPEALAHPAPTITLTAAEAEGNTASTESSTDNGTRDIAFVGLGLGAIGAALGLFAAIRSRKE
ncbi:MAG: YcnI family protein [Nocardiaceae bacterium]|nr:YcnI family protein [Nocardiaceae bacterium]